MTEPRPEGGIFILRHREPDVAQSIVDLQRIAYGVEAELIDYAKLPPLADTPQDIMASGERFFGFFNGWNLAGMIACEGIRNGLLISRLCVHPDTARQGIGSRLVLHVVSHAETTVNVTTARDNYPAINLYTRIGFQPISYFFSSDGLALVAMAYRQTGA